MMGPLGIGVGALVIGVPPEAHLGEDLYAHHWDAAWNQVSESIGQALDAVPGPASFLGGVLLIEVEHDVTAAMAVDWSTLSWSTITAITTPGTFSAILQERRARAQVTLRG